MRPLKIKDPTAEIRSVLAGNPLILTHQSFMDNTMQEVAGFLQRLFQELGIGFLAELAIVIIKEMVTNATRAAAKRQFFEASDLKIDQPADYRKGIVLFREEITEHWDEWISKKMLQDAVELSVHLVDEQVQIQTRGQYELLPQEHERIQQRLHRFDPAASFESAMEANSDDQEGAGLGILLCLTLLSNAGIPAENFQIKSGAGITSSSVRLPMQVVSPALHKRFNERVLAEIEEIPSFPQHISNLIQLCDSENASVQRIASEIQRDPALAASVLRLVHSAGYMNRMRNPSLTDAVKVIGLKTLKNLLMVTGVTNVIQSRYRLREMEQIWERSHRVSFYARSLAQGKASLAEIVTIAGLLHYLGKIVLLSLDESRMKVIQTLFERRSVRTASSLEENMLGISHPEIAAHLMRKWNFPESLVQTVAFQSKPLFAPTAHKESITTVYMAIRIEEILTQKKDFYFIEWDVLSSFQIDSEADFMKLAEKLQKLYQAP